MHVFILKTTCWVCNGYYGSNFGEPMCPTCHSFLFAPYECDAPENTCVSDEEDSGNDEPLFEDRDRQDREGSTDNVNVCGVAGSSKSTKNNNFNSVPKPNAVRSLSHYIEALSQPYENGSRSSKSNTSISDLPVEGKIISKSDNMQQKQYLLFSISFSTSVNFLLFGRFNAMEC